MEQKFSWRALDRGGYPGGHSCQTSALTPASREVTNGVFARMHEGAMGQLGTADAESRQFLRSLHWQVRGQGWHLAQNFYML